jgi:fibronectin-binding autotransporter adhesin
VGGNVVVANGGTLSGAAGQTLTMPGLVLNNSSNVNVALGAPSATGLFQVNGDLTLDGTLNLANAGGFGPGLYRLFNYTGTLTDGGLVLGSLAGAPSSNLLVQTSVANQVNLVFDLGPQNFWRGGNGTWTASPSSTAWTDFLGSTSVAWTPQFALFQTAPGTVTVDTSAGPVGFAGAQFAIDGYTVAGGALTNNTANAVVRVGDGTNAGAAMTATVAAPITGTGGINKTDLGTLVLSGNNTYAGATTVSNGTLRVNGNQSGATGAVTVASGAALAGSGTLGGAVTVANGGTLAGQTGQTLAMAGLTLNNTSAVNVSLGAPSATGLFQVNGNLTLDGTLNLSDAGGFGAGLYRLFNYTGALTDNGLAFGSIAGAIPGNLSLQTSVANQVNVILIDTTTLLPIWQGGSGTWNANVTGSGFSNASGSLAGGWRPGFAVFGGSPGTVTVDSSAGAVVVTGVQFATSGYVVTGSELTTQTYNSPFRVGDGTAAGSNFSATVSAAVTGAGGIEKLDLGRLVLTGTNSYLSGTTVTGGVLEVSRDANLGASTGAVTLNGGTLRTSSAFASARTFALTAAGGTLDTAADLTLQGAIIGTGGLTKTGAGRLTLSGSNTFTGATTIAAGSVQLNNSSLGATTVASGASLSGNGTIRGNLTNHGILSPGASPGTITVNGNFTQSATGSYAVELASATSFDKLAISGAANLGGSLIVTNLNGYVPQPGQTFSILTATGGVSGSFANVTTPWSQFSAMLRFQPTYGPNDVTLAMLQRPFADLNGTQAQMSLAQAVDGAIAATSISDLRNSLNALTTDATVLAALDQLSPQRYERWFEQAVLSTAATVRTADHRLTEVNAKSRGGVWFELTRRETSFDASGSSAPAEGEANGILTGIDAVVTPAVHAGLLFGYLDEKLDLDENGSRTSTERFNVAAYARYDASPLWWEAVAGFGKSNLDSARTVAIPGYQKVATSKTHGFEGFADLRAATPLERSGFTLAPYAAVQYVYWQGNSFDETGADDANLAMDAMTGQSFSGRAGLTISRVFPRAGGTLVPRLDVAWRHEFQDETRTLSGQLAGTAFALQSRKPDTDAITASLGLDADLNNRLNAYLRLDGLWGDMTSGFEAQAGLSYRF